MINEQVLIDPYLKGYNFTKTEDISKATHWIAEPDENNISENFGVIPSQVYDLFYHPYRDEYFIQDDRKDLSQIWLAHKGHFVILEKMIVASKF